MNGVWVLVVLHELCHVTVCRNNTDLRRLTGDDKRCLDVLMQESVRCKQRFSSFGV
jgi:hypothetical protein